MEKLLLHNGYDIGLDEVCPFVRLSDLRELLTMSEADLIAMSPGSTFLERAFALTVLGEIRSKAGLDAKEGT